MIKQAFSILLVMTSGYSSAVLFGYVEVGLFVMSVLGLYLTIWGTE